MEALPAEGKAGSNAGSEATRVGSNGLFQCMLFMLLYKYSSKWKN